MDWWKPEAKYDYDISRKIKAEGCRQLKRKELECRVLHADGLKCEEHTKEFLKCTRILNYIMSEQ